ncbi:rhamnose/proton symporter RhaT [Paenibacillus sp. PK3_47]|uniref:L-rhamnose/proton symporter RhaT n=1 Tax=Paenibacillus sp. PK3_47 TaxID=2072642 RepID=UPI00201DFD92|nr:L-rhamnose/proton symporter RhaT [Paenibacillus sp. PK3_47]UQZ36010.1 rhamnose/proton symporter RhaT [Paenibacillus sp. PK3_47]
MIYGFLLLLLGCFFQGSFGLGMKKYQPFSWEAFWVIFSVVGILIIPAAWTWIEVPNFFSYIRQTSGDVLWTAAFCGFLWGISSIMFGKAIDSIGVSLTYGVNMGISASFGSLIPLFIFGNIPAAGSFTVLLIGAAIMLAGVAVITRAGLLKEKMITASGSGTSRGGSLTAGLVIASVAGLGSAAMNIGFSFANEAVDIAVADGVPKISASLISWVITLSGGFIANFAYAFILLIKNKSYKDYVAKGAGTAYAKALATALIWFLALGFYAKATALLGPLGAVVGWLIFNGLALIISNAWGLKDGEWKGFAAPKKLLLRGNAILILSWIVVGIANSMA